MSKRLLLNAALVLVAIAMVVGIQMLNPSVTVTQAGETSPTPTPKPTPTPTPTPTPKPTPTPTPTPKPTTCSPGFWKNHTELWFGPDFCGKTSEETLCDLKPQCHKDSAARHAAAACIEAAVGHLCDE